MFLAYPIRRLFRAAALAALMVSAGTATASTGRAAHHSASGRLGPFPAVRADYAYENPAAQSGFSGRVVVGTRTYQLPPPDEPADFFDLQVLAVIFADADRKPGNELLVLYDAQKIGPQTDDYTGVCVYRWTGKGFERVRSIEVRLRGSRNAAEIRRRLARGGRR